MKLLFLVFFLTSCVTVQPKPTGLTCHPAGLDCDDYMAQLSQCTMTADWNPYAMGEVTGDRYMITFTKAPLNAVFLEVCESVERDDDLLIRQGFTLLGSCQDAGQSFYFYQKEIDGDNTGNPAPY